MYICNITEGKEEKKILERGGRLGAALQDSDDLYHGEKYIRNFLNINIFQRRYFPEGYIYMAVIHAYPGGVICRAGGGVLAFTLLPVYPIY